MSNEGVALVTKAAALMLALSVVAAIFRVLMIGPREKAWRGTVSWRIARRSLG
jgi:hypothetical protein